MIYDTEPMYKIQTFAKPYVFCWATVYSALQRNMASITNQTCFEGQCFAPDCLHECCRYSIHTPISRVFSDWEASDVQKPREGSVKMLTCPSTQPRDKWGGSCVPAGMCYWAAQVPALASQRHSCRSASQLWAQGPGCDLWRGYFALTAQCHFVFT